MENKNKMRLFTPKQAIKNKAEFVGEMISLLEYGIHKIEPFAQPCLCHAGAIIIQRFNYRYSSHAIQDIFSQIGISKNSVKILSPEQYENVYEAYWFKHYSPQPRIDYLKKILKTYENLN